MIVFDDLEASEKIKVCDRGISVNPSQENVYQMLIGYRAGDMWAPQLGITEALQHRKPGTSSTASSTRRRRRPTASAGLRVVRLLEAATRSMAQQGALVPLGTRRRRASDREEVAGCSSMLACLRSRRSSGSSRSRTGSSTITSSTSAAGARCCSASGRRATGSIPACRSMFGASALAQTDLRVDAVRRSDAGLDRVRPRRGLHRRGGSRS